MKRRPGKFYYQAVFTQTDSGKLQLPGPDGRAHGFSRVIHRENVDGSLFCIPNELICCKLASFLGLPVPPFTISHLDGKPYFTALNFNPQGDRLPPIQPDVCAAAFPRLCTGILFFDVLVANEDRHDENIAADNIASPKQIIIYDHEQALFGGGGNLAGVERLAALRDRLGITGGSVTGGNECCLLRSLKTLEYFQEWRGRILDIPDWFFEEACNTAVGLGIEEPQARAARDFLIYREKNIVRIIKSCGDTIPLIADWSPSIAFLE